MKILRFDKVPSFRSDPGTSRCHFPFRLGGQAFPCPTGIRGRFVIAHMRDGSMQVEGAQTRERHFVPLVVEALPVKWRVPSLTLHGVPTIGQPVTKVTVA